MKLQRAAAIALAVAALAGCSTVQTPSKDDPWEGLNRTVFTFNDKVDRYALKPVAQGYVKITPQPVRDSVTNFFSNIGDVYVAANNLLQLKIADGVGDIMRIVINTVFGVGGLFDVATLAKLPKHDTDLGITLGHYGVPSGPYLVLPLFGPSTVRDAAGYVGNYFANPISYIDSDAISWSLWGVQLVNTRANLLNASDVLEGAALDKYSFVRNAYLQRRQYLLTGGTSGALPNYGDGAALPNYDQDGAGAAGAAGAVSGGGAVPAAPASSAAPSQAPEGTSGTSGTPAAEGASPASGTPSIDTVPGGQVVPPGRYPSLRLR
ncbi:MlaA family lipoprotein [Paraburkholderia sp. SOS3]|uniref:MlaA family lipoprotein n=1 Tax=Paraburkholderia sp. SOS3 TaxID=1926494 RepID=UPI0009477808|nr:VacJ family lipoprotein [Paraburkholderia sp. SOS3]APR37113.1 ABC transporter [Paraburkholderia sp. SOS3]